MSARTLLLHLLGRRFGRCFFLHFRFSAQQSLHVLHRAFLHDHVHSALDAAGKTLWLQSITNSAEKERYSHENVDDLSPETAHFPESERCFFLAGFAEYGIVEINFLRQVRSSRSSFEPNHFARFIADCTTPANNAKVEAEV